MSTNKLIELSRFGQSFWYDNISRDFIDSGRLKSMIETDGLKGITSNPAIFYKSIKDGKGYDKLLKSLSSGSLTDKDIFYEIAINDIKDAAKILLPVYQATNAKDGYVSIEVDPNFADNYQETIKEARMLFNKIGMDNVMIKVPATDQGLKAVKTLISEGININVTLLFSNEKYDQTIIAYIEGLEERLKEGKSIEKIASVASFFISRIDSAFDKVLTEKSLDTTNADERQWYFDTMGKVAISNAKMAYQSMVSVFSSDRFLKLKQKGAMVQRLLWASTSTKNPAYSNVLYVNELIGPNTINTMPQETLDAFRDHGVVKRTIDLNIEDANNIIDSLCDGGLDYNSLTDKLLIDGLRLFVEAFNSLLALISEKRSSL
ncbi:MAG: transaldolase [Nitrospirae bacterium]|nr:transaldolase [Nitrospirota bacterium]